MKLYKIIELLIIKIIKDTNENYDIIGKSRYYRKLRNYEIDFKTQKYSFFFRNLQGNYIMVTIDKKHSILEFISLECFELVI